VVVVAPILARKVAAADAQAAVRVVVPMAVVPHAPEDVRHHVQVDAMEQQQDNALLAQRLVCRLVGTDVKTHVLGIVTPLATMLVELGVILLALLLRKVQTLVYLVMVHVAVTAELLVLSIVPETVITLAGEHQVSLT